MLRRERRFEHNDYPYCDHCGRACADDDFAWCDLCNECLCEECCMMVPFYFGIPCAVCDTCVCTACDPDWLFCSVDGCSFGVVRERCSAQRMQAERASILTRMPLSSDSSVGSAYQVRLFVILSDAASVTSCTASRAQPALEMNVALAALSATGRARSACAFGCEPRRSAPKGCVRCRRGCTEVAADVRSCSTTRPRSVLSSRRKQQFM